MRAYILLLGIAIILLISHVVAYAQGASATIAFPTNNSTGVVIQPTIIIHTHFPIDSSGITWDYGRRDSASKPSAWPTIRLLPRSYVDSLADSLQKSGAIHGEYLIVDDTTLSFTPISALQYGVEYKVSVKNLAVVVDTAVGPGAPDTIAVAETSILFTTVLPTHAVLGTTTDWNSSVRCGDTLRVVFNRKLGSDTTVTGPLVQLVHLDSVHATSDTTFNRYTDTVSVSTWLSADSAVLNVKPTSSLLLGGNYYLYVKTSRITGDTLTDVTSHFSVRDRFKLHVDVIDEDTSHSAPSGELVSVASDSYPAASETVRLNAVPDDSSYAFVKWSSPGYPDIDQKTSPTIEFSQSCSALTDLTVQAVFRRRDTLVVTVADTTHTWTKVFRVDGGQLTFLADTGTFGLPPGAAIQIFGGSNSSAYQFTQWSSNSSSYNGDTHPTMMIKNTGRNIGPIRIVPANPVLFPPLPICSICTHVEWNDNSKHLIPASDAVTTVPAAGTCADNDPNIPGNPPCPVPTVVSGIVTKDCYVINEVMVIDANGTIIYDLYGPGVALSSWNSATAPPDNLGRGPLSLFKTTPATQVWFGVEARTYELDLTTTLLQARRLGSSFSDGQVGSMRDVRLSAWYVHGGHKELLYMTPNQAPPLTNRTTVTTTDIFHVACGETIEVRAEYKIREEGFEFQQWNDLAGYTYPTPQLESFQFVMDQDRKVEAIFKEDFRLRQVGVYLADAAGSSPSHWFSPSVMRSRMAEDLNVWLSNTGGVHRGTRMHFKFNDPPNTSTLDNGLTAQELTQRIDGYGGTVLYRGTSTYITTADAGREVIMEMKDATLGSSQVPGTPRGEQLGITLRTYIVNDMVERLYQSYEFQVETEMPGVEINIVGATPLSSSGDGDVELYNIWTADLKSGTGVSMVTPGSGNLPSTDFPPGVSPGTEETYGSGGNPFTALAIDKMDKYGEAILTMDSYDYDGSGGIDHSVHEDIVRSQQEITAVIVGFLVGGGSALLAVALGAAALSAAWIGFGAFFLLWKLLNINAVWDWLRKVFSNNDDSLGTGRWMFKWSDGEWFGGNPSVRYQQTRPFTENGDIGYHVDFKLRK